MVKLQLVLEYSIQWEDLTQIQVIRQEFKAPICTTGIQKGSELFWRLEAMSWPCGNRYRHAFRVSVFVVWNFKPEVRRRQAQLFVLQQHVKIPHGEGYIYIQALITSISYDFFLQPWPFCSGSHHSFKQAHQWHCRIEAFIVSINESGWSFLGGTVYKLQLMVVFWIRHSVKP
jgi:hypothetical protein